MKYYLGLLSILILALVSCRVQTNRLSLDQCLENMNQLRNLNIIRLECIDYWEFERNDYKAISSDSNYYEFNTVQGLLLKSNDSLRGQQFPTLELSKQIRFIIDSLKIVSLSCDPMGNLLRAEFLMEKIDVESLWEQCFKEKTDETLDNIAGPLSYGCAVNRYSKYLYVTSDRSQVNRNCYRFFKYKNYYFQICGVGPNDLDEGQ